MKLETIRDTILTLKKIDIFEQTRRRDVVEMRCVANHYMSTVKQMRLMDIVRDYQRCGYETHHATILHSLRNYKQNCYYNIDLEEMYKTLLGDNKLFVLERIPDATDKQIEQIEEILLG
jgi:hypothetical protein